MVKAFNEVESIKSYMMDAREKYQSPNYIFCMFFLVFFATTPFFGQNDNFYTRLQERKINIEQYWESFNLSKDVVEAANGSPYANDHFLPGRIYEGTQAISNMVYLRYNAFSDEIEIKPSDASLAPASIKKDPNIFAKIGEDMYLYAENNNPKKGGYFKIVKDLTVYDLVKKMNVTFREKQYAKTSYGKDKPAEFVSETTYFLTDDKGVFYELPKSRAKMANILPDKKEVLKSYMKKNKIDLSSEKDLIQLAVYLNTLL